MLSSSTKEVNGGRLIQFSDGSAMFHYGPAIRAYEPILVYHFSSDFTNIADAEYYCNYTCNELENAIRTGNKKTFQTKKIDNGNNDATKTDAQLTLF